MQVGERYNKLTVISDEFIKFVGKQNRKMRKFLCDCGNECEKNEYKVRVGHTTSCGCWGKSPKPQKIKYKDINRGCTKTKLYQKWTDLRKKHRNDMVEEWCDFLSFKNWSESNNYQDNGGLVLYRINNNLPFGPNNCKFIHTSERYKYYDVNSPENVTKRKNTCLKKYGKEHPWQNKEVMQKAIDTCVEKYGRYPVINNGTSKPELEIQEWLLSLGREFKTNWKILKGKQIDLYSEEYQIGIEYCGVYWHTDKSKTSRDSRYHYDKYQQCLDNGIQLFTIFSDEWEKNKEGWKNLIRASLGSNDIRIFARKCKVSEIAAEIGQKFLQNYHIQGAKRKAKVYFGIFYLDELVGVISLNSHHRNIKGQIVLDRLCFKSGVQIVGGATKLLKRCIEWSKSRGYKEIITWSDNRYSQGNVYEKTGFQMKQELKPDYSYVDLNDWDDRRFSKQSMKTKEKDKELMKNYGKIYDCGKKRYVLDIQ